MRPVRVSTSISAPREDVFDFVADIANRVAWCDHYMREFHLTRPRSYGEGAAARFEVEPPFARSWAELAIAEVDRPRRIVERGRIGRLGRTPYFAIYEFTPAPGLTRVDLTFWTEPATRVDAIKESFGARGWLRRQKKAALERLRKIFEERPEAPLARATVAGYEPEKAARFGA
jgi:uncharacterized protein YndB with AHSA1/START domain